MSAANEDMDLVNLDDSSLSTLGASRRLSTIDDCTIFNTPAPLAASTVAPAERRNRGLYMDGGQGSFLDNASFTSNPGSGSEDRGIVPFSLNKMNGFGSGPSENQHETSVEGDSTLKDGEPPPVAAVRPSMDFLKARDLSFENRSSLGLLNFDAMGDLSSSLLHFETSPHKPASHSRGSLFNYSKAQLSGTHSGLQAALTPNEGQGHTVRDVKSLSSINSRSNGNTPRPASVNHDQNSNPNIASSNGSRSNPVLDALPGMVIGAAKDPDDLDTSVVEVELNEDELKQFDETFSDIGEFEQTLTDDISGLASNNLAYKGLGQRGEASGHYSDDDDYLLSSRGGEGQEDEGSDQRNSFQRDGRDIAQHFKRHPKLAEVRSQPSGDWSTSSESISTQEPGAGGARELTSLPRNSLNPPLDSIYLRRSPQSHEEGDGQEEQDRDDASLFLDGPPNGSERSAPSLLFRGRTGYLGDESEIDTDDEIAAVRRENAERDRWLQESGSHHDLEWASGRPGLEGVSSEDADRLQHMLETRQSAEGDVMSSPVPGDGGGGGDGSSGHSSEDDSGHGGSIQGTSQTTMEVLQGLGFVGRGSQQFRPMRMQSDRFQEDNPEAQRRIRPMGDDLLSETNTRHVRFDLETTRSRTLSGASATDAESILDDRDQLDANDSFEPESRFLSSQFLQPSASGGLTQGSAEADEEGSVTRQTSLFPDDTGFENENADFTYSNNNVSLGLGVPSNSRNNEAQNHPSFGHSFSDVSLAFGGESLRFPEGQTQLSNFTFSNNDVSLGFGAMRPATSPQSDRLSDQRSDRLSDPVSDRSSDSVHQGRHEHHNREQKDQRGDGNDKEDDALLLSHLDESSYPGPPHGTSNSAIDKTASFNKGTKAFLSENSPVYVNEEGEVVTDLAYYQSLDEMAQCPVNPFEDSGAALDFAVAADFSEVEFNSADEFIPAENASQLLDEDEAKFAEENIFTQDEVMEVESFGLPDNWTYRDEDEAAAYMRISIGEFWRSKSEALGSLYGDKFQPRPSFGGSKVATPPDGQPFSLLPQPSQTSPTLENIPESFSRPEDVRGSGVGSDIDVGDRTLHPEDISQPTSQATPQANRSASSLDNHSPAVRNESVLSHKVAETTAKTNKGDGNSESSDSFSDISKMILVASGESNPDDLVALILKTSNSATVVKSKNKSGTAAVRSQSLDTRRPVEESQKGFTHGPAMSLDFRRPDGKSQSTDMRMPKRLPQPNMARPSDMPGQENMSSLRSHQPLRASHDVANEANNHFQSKPDTTGSSLDTSNSSRGRVEGQADDPDSDSGRSRRSFSSKIPVLVRNRSRSVEGRTRLRSGSVSDDSQKAAATRPSKQLSNSFNQSQSKRNVSQKSPPAQRRDAAGTSTKEARPPSMPVDGWKSPRPSSVFQTTEKDVGSNAQRNILSELASPDKENENEQSHRPSAFGIGRSSVSPSFVKQSGMSARSLSGSQMDQNSEHRMLQSRANAQPSLAAKYDSFHNQGRGHPDDMDDPTQYSLGDEDMYRDVELLPSDGSFSNLSQDTVENADRTLTPDGREDPGNRSNRTSTHASNEQQAQQKYTSSCSSPRVVPVVRDSDCQQSTPKGKSPQTVTPAVSKLSHSYPASSPELSKPLTSWQHGLTQQSSSENRPPAPTLLTSQSLTKTPFAKQYLKDSRLGGTQNVPPGRDSIPATPSNKTYIESSFIYSPMTVERPGGMKGQLYDASRMSISMDTSEAFDSTPASQTVPSYTFIDAPSELRVPEVCCVGVSTHAILPLHNPSTKWLHVSLTIKRLLISSVAKDVDTVIPFVMKEKVIVEPGTTEHVQVIFAPQQAGAFVAELEVVSYPILNQPTETQRLPTVVTLQAVAEMPNIELLSVDNSVLNFGALPWGSQRCLPLHLVNHGRTQVPIRLQVTMNNTTWHGFTFERSQSDSSPVISCSPRPGSLSSAPSVVNYTIPAATEGRASLKVVQIRFKSSQHERATANGAAEAYTARVEALLDTPNAVDVLAAINLRASAGTAKLHVPRDTDVVEFNTQAGRSCQKTVILRNAGNIPLEVCLEVTHWPDLFTVIPCQTIIPTGAQKEILVRFEPKHTKATKFESLLLMFMSPDGPGYEMELLGHITSQTQNKITLLSNRSQLVWGGVRIGQAAQQSVILKSSSSQVTKVRLQIKDNSQDFQLQNFVSSSAEIYLRPNEEYPVHVLFAPSKMAPCTGRLQVKDLHSTTKYMIPLTGYGGTSNIVVENLQRGHSQNVYATRIGTVTLAVPNISQIQVSNHGDRAAYVRAVPFQELECKTRLPDTRLTIKPREFCLLPHQTKLVNIILSPSAMELSLCKDRASIVAAIALCCGDEVSRQQMRKSLLLCNRGTFKLAEGNPLRGIQFDIPYLEEDLVDEPHPGKPDMNCIELFYTNMIISTVALVGSPPPPEGDIRLHTVPAPSLLAQAADHERLTCSLYPLAPSMEISPPASGKSGLVAALFPTSPPKAPSVDDTLVETDVDWAVQPEHLMLSAPRKSGTHQVKRVQIINFSNRSLTYELSWPGHCIMATPEHDTIQPRSSGIIIVSPVSSIHSKIALPWSGRIYVTSGQSRKVIKVQIHEELSQDDSVVVTNDNSSTYPLMSAPDTPLLSISTSMPPAQNLKPMNEALEFNATRIGVKSEMPIVLTNTSGEEVKFVISSFAPAYVKVGGSSEVYRANYSAFHVVDKAGVLHPKEKVKVPVVFRPRQCGQFSQYWEIRSQLPTSTSSSTQTCKIHFTGQAVADSSSASVSSSSLTPSTMVSARTTTSTRPPEKKLYFMTSKVEFEMTSPGVARNSMIKICNKDYSDHEVQLIPPASPFSCRTVKAVTIRPRHYVRVNLFFLPMEPGQYTQPLQCTTDLDTTLTATLVGHCS